MIQNNDAMMVEKIQTSIVNTIPLWKSQMVLVSESHIRSRPWKPSGKSQI
jgi:hypothetical protein